MGTDFTIFIADGYCIPLEIFRAIVQVLKKKETPQTEVELTMVYAVNHFSEVGMDYDFSFAEQDGYNQREQFNKMVFLYSTVNKQTIFSEKVGGSTLCQFCPIRDEPEWKDSGLYGGARLPLAIRLGPEEEEEEEEAKPKKKRAKTLTPLEQSINECDVESVQKLGLEIIKQCKKWKGRWLFSYFH